MEIRLESIEIREVLHFLGWQGSPVEKELLLELKGLISQVLEEVQPRAVWMRFEIEKNGRLKGTSFLPKGREIQRMLAPCHEAVLLAATLGAKSERLLLREQAKSDSRAVLMDAVLSAAIEAVCDQIEEKLRMEILTQRQYLTDRYSPGYGDMPVLQTKEICEVLSAGRSAGLTVSSSGIMIPRKSVTAIMGISRQPVRLRPAGCEGCPARNTCAFAKKKRDA